MFRTEDWSTIEVPREAPGKEKDQRLSNEDRNWENEELIVRDGEENEEKAEPNGLRLQVKTIWAQRH